MRRLVVKIFLGAIALLAVVEAASIGRPTPMQSPPLLHATNKLPAGVKQVVERACKDCHSSETQWPWYSGVIPVSWMMQRDIRMGRKHLDFSKWVLTSSNPTSNQAEEMCDEMTKGNMPPKPYRLMHRDARLSKNDVAEVCNWADMFNGQGAKQPSP